MARWAPFCSSMRTSILSVAVSRIRSSAVCVSAWRRGSTSSRRTNGGTSGRHGRCAGLRSTRSLHDLTYPPDDDRVAERGARVADERGVLRRSTGDSPRARRELLRLPGIEVPCQSRRLLGLGLSTKHYSLYRRAEWLIRAVNTAVPTTRPAHSLFKLLNCPLDMLLSRF